MDVEIYKMVYKISNNVDKLRIFGENFVANNENKGNIIINNKKEKIKSILSLNNLNKNKIKIVLNKNIYNISCMFKDCELLESFSYINLQNIKDIINNEYDIQIINNENSNLINYSINECLYDNDTDNYFSVSQLRKKEEKYDGTFLSLPDITQANISHFFNMNFMFSNCNSLKYIPDISFMKKNDTTNMIDMSYMFSNCSSLVSLPDISKWKTDNVIDMSYMFSNCSSLLSLPDISKWKTDNVADLSFMFSNCNSLKYI